MLSWSVPDRLAELRGLIAAHARPGMGTSIDGLHLSKVDHSDPDFSLTAPLLVVMAQGGKRLLLGEQLYEYRAGDCLVVTAHLPITGHWIDTDASAEALGMGLVLHPAAVAALLLQHPEGGWSRRTSTARAIATGKANAELLDAAARMLRLFDHPADARVLAPLIVREILWRLLAGPLGDTMRQIGLADSDLSHVSRAIAWIRENYAEPMRVDDLARLSGMSASAFHRHFRSVTALSPLQFQKRIRLQHARSLLIAHPGDVAGVGHQVGYDSPSQFTREYRRLFGAAPGQDAQRLRTEPSVSASLFP